MVFLLVPSPHAWLARYRSLADRSIDNVFGCARRGLSGRNLRYPCNV